SASRGSPTMLSARPYTRAWNRFTKADAAARSPSPIPSRRASSERLLGLKRSRTPDSTSRPTDEVNALTDTDTKGAPAGIDSPSGRRPQAGPTSRIEAVCRRPRPSTQLTRTVSPGWWVERVEVRDDGEVTVVPSTPTIVSPMEMPAASAGLPATIPATRAPDPGLCCTATPRYPRCDAGADGLGTVPPPA